MLTTLKNIVSRILGIKSPSLGMRYALDEQIKKLLGIQELERKVQSLEFELGGLRGEFNAQIAMVGIDIHQRGRKNGGVQTEIILISHLGPEKGMGSIRIVEAEFGSYLELMDFVKHCENSLKHRPAIDGPMGLGREFGSW